MLATLAAVFPLPMAEAQGVVEEIRDARNALIGTITQRGGGWLEARAASGRLVGRFDTKRRVTRDERNRLVSYGNTLSALLLCSGQVGPAR